MPKPWQDRLCGFESSPLEPAKETSEIQVAIREYLLSYLQFRKHQTLCECEVLFLQEPESEVAHETADDVAVKDEAQPPAPSTSSKDDANRPEGCDPHSAVLDSSN